MNEVIETEKCKICGEEVQTKSKMKLHLANKHQVVGENDEHQSADDQNSEYFE